MQEIAGLKITNNGPTEILYQRQIGYVHGNEDNNIQHKMSDLLKLTQQLISFKSQNNREHRERHRHA